MKKTLLILSLFVGILNVFSQPIEENFIINKFYTNELKLICFRYNSDYTVQNYLLDSDSMYSKIIYNKDYEEQGIGRDRNSYFTHYDNTSNLYLNIYEYSNQRLIFTHKKDTMVVDICKMDRFSGFFIDSLVFSPGCYYYIDAYKSFSGIYSLEDKDSFIIKTNLRDLKNLTTPNYNNLNILNFYSVDNKKMKISKDLKIESYFMYCPLKYSPTTLLPYIKSDYKINKKPYPYLTTNGYYRNLRFLLTDFKDTMIVDLVNLDFANQINIDTLFFNSGYYYYDFEKKTVKKIGKDTLSNLNYEKLNNYHILTESFQMQVSIIQDDKYIDNSDSLITYISYLLKSNEAFSPLGNQAFYKQYSNKAYYCNNHPFYAKNRLSICNNCFTILNSEFENQRLAIFNGSDTTVIDIVNNDKLFSFDILLKENISGYYLIDVKKNTQGQEGGSGGGGVSISSTRPMFGLIDIYEVENYSSLLKEENE